MRPTPPTERPTASQADSHADKLSGLVIVVGGVGGLDWCGLALRFLVKVKNLPYAVQIVPWGLGFGRWYADLSNIINRDAKARLIADKIRDFKTSRPDQAIFIVAKSGGSGIIVKALEPLEEDTVERVVLLAPALSPGYDLTNALRAVRSEMVVFWSPLDVVILGAGTRLFGTIDRVKSVGAGLVGFRVPATDTAGSDSAQRREYGKLRQVRWSTRMAATGYFGGHMGPDSPLFLSRYVVPLLRVEDPTRP